MPNVLREMYWAQQNSDPLPKEYRRVEYIKSSGAQWIDTGVVISEGSCLEVVCQGSETIGYICGAGDSYYIHMFSGGDGNVYTARVLSQGIYSTVSQYEKATLILDIYNKQFKANGTVYATITATGTYPNLSSYLFGLHKTNNSNFFVGKVFSYLMKDNDVPVRNFIPCVRISDNKPGMYDLCGSIGAKTGTSFYVNEGTGADFTWGELA